MNINKKIAISESGFIFDSSSGDSYSVNPVAMEILELIREGNSLEEIKKLLLDKYEVAEAVLDHVLDDFISTSKKFKIVED